jgi:hypothetical protein
MSEYTITDFSLNVLNKGLFVTDMHNIFTAIITFDNGDWMGVSQWDDEDVWRADCAFRANGYPLWSHGTGQGMRGLPADQCGPLNDAVVSYYENMPQDDGSWEADAYNREAQEESLGRPLFPNEY